jgi:hypothetical protein
MALSMLVDRLHRASTPLWDNATSPGAYSMAARTLGASVATAKRAYDQKSYLFVEMVTTGRSAPARNVPE